MTNQSCPTCGFVGGCECAYLCEGCNKAYAPDGGLCRECLSIMERDERHGRYIDSGPANRDDC
jgi:hypothetical protein